MLPRGHPVSASEGFDVPTPGRYRVSYEAYPYQANTPVGVTVYRGRLSGQAASLDELIGSFDLVGDSPRTVTMTPFLRPGDLISPSPADLDGNPNSAARGDPSEGFDMKAYPGEGIALKSLSIEGPLIDAWPPASTRQLLTGVEFDASGEIRLTKEPFERIVDIVAALAPRAFRRPLEDGELEAYASPAEPVLARGRPFIEAVRVPIRAILTSPAFFYQVSDSQTLDDFALASRLSYFLWRGGLLTQASVLKITANGTTTSPVPRGNFVLASLLGQPAPPPPAGERGGRKEAGRLFRRPTYGRDGAR